MSCLGQRGKAGIPQFFELLEYTQPIWNVNAECPHNIRNSAVRSQASAEAGEALIYT